MGDVAIVAEHPAEPVGHVGSTVLARRGVRRRPRGGRHANHLALAQPIAGRDGSTTRDGLGSYFAPFRQNAESGENRNTDLSTEELVLVSKRVVCEWALQDLNPRQLGPKPSTLSRLS